MVSPLEIRLTSVLASMLAVALLASPAIAAQGDCGQPVTTGAGPTASDCLFILSAAVGSETCEPACVCDANGSGGVTASDALVCLAKAVGQDVALECPCDATTTSSITITTSTTTTSSSSTTSSIPSGACGLMVNGSFDDPVTSSPQNGWSFANVGGPGWQGDGGNPGGYFTLNASGELATDPTLTQIIEDLSIGASYRITGDYRSFAAGFGDPEKPDAFAVSVDPQPLDHDSTTVLGLPRPSPDANAWTMFSVDFVAADTTATISFIAERDGDDSSFDVDNLCLTAP